MIRFKEIQIQPTDGWFLDVIICNKKDELNKFLAKIYGGHKDMWTNENITYSGNEVFYTTRERDRKFRIVMTLTGRDKNIIVHEIIHVLWKLNKLLGYEITDGSQEWQAIMAEYLFREIANFKSYKLIK